MDKKYLRISNNRKKGFSLVEVILANALFVLVVTILAGVYLYGQESTALSGSRARATLLAEEGLEAVRNIRDDDFANITDGTHGLARSGNQWVFSGASDSTDIFSRAITISTVDASRKSIVSTVTWQQNAQRTGTVSLSSRLNYWMEVVSSIGDWSTPTTTADININGNQDGQKLQVVGDYVYLVRAGGSPDFLIIDVSDPDSPTTAGTLALGGAPRNIAVSGDYAYVSSTSNGQEVQIIDISTPASPSLVGSYNAPGNTNMLGIYVVGTTVYASRDSSGEDELYIINATVPAVPVLLGSLELGADANEVYVSGSYAYVASDSNSGELQVVDVSVPATPSLAASLDLSTNDNAETVIGSGSTVIIGRSTDDGFLHTIDVTTPTSPSLLGTYTAGDDVRDVTLGNGDEYVFVATDSNSAEFQVVDISTLASPTLLGSLDLSSDINGVAYSENKDRAFVAAENNGEEFIVLAPQ